MELVAVREIAVLRSYESLRRLRSHHRTTCLRRRASAT
jgi:hypothetical protein